MSCREKKNQSLPSENVKALYYRKSSEKVNHNRKTNKQQQKMQEKGSAHKTLRC